MKILLTGATGYIGQRLLTALVKEGHYVYCCVRDVTRFSIPESMSQSIKEIEVDFLDAQSLSKIPKEIDAAFYLIHSMSSSKNYQELEEKCASNFVSRLNQTNVKQVIYLSGIVNEDKLSKHLSSRKNVENILKGNQFHLTTLRAGIIIGSGSASFEIIRDLVEKLPIMIAPKWLNTLCQPIGIREVIQFLCRTLFNEETYDESFDIGGSDILSYKEMLLRFAKFRGLKRYILTVPIMTPRLSSYWLYFVTSTSYQLASSLVESMDIEVICRDNRLSQMLNVQPESYEVALDRAFNKIKINEIVSSWKDAQASGVKEYNISDFIDVPTYGCFKDMRSRPILSKVNTIERIWKIGGPTGWYYANFLWKLRGYLDKLFGGVGLRRGRTHVDLLEPGDALDFWRVLYADKEEGRLLLFAEMKLPGEAWLEFKFEDKVLKQTATFRPQGILGRMYWYSVLPFHGLVFNGMIKALAK